MRCVSLSLSLSLSLLCAVASADDLGTWTTIATSTNTENSQDVRKGWGRMAIHMLLLPDKRLLIMNRSRSDPETAFMPALISSSSGSNPYLYDRFTEVPMPEPEEDHEIFCAGHTLMEDGTPFFAGGHLHHDNNGLNELFRFVSDDWALYMLFVLDDMGVPAEAKIVRLRDFAPVYIGDSAGSFTTGGPALPPAYGSSLFLPENGYLGSYVYSANVGGTHTVEMEVWGYHTTTAAQVLRFSLEGKTNQGTDVSVSFYDWGEDEYEEVGTTSWSADSEVSQTFLAGNYGEPVGTHRFIRSSDKKILVRPRWTRTASSFQGRFDLMEVGVR